MSITLIKHVNDVIYYQNSITYHQTGPRTFTSIQ